MGRHQRALFAAAAGLCVFLSACGPAKTDKAVPGRPVVGVKIYEAAPPFDGLFRQWRDLGVNTLFVSEASAKSPEKKGILKALVH